MMPFSFFFFKKKHQHKVSEKLSFMQFFLLFRFILYKLNYFFIQKKFVNLVMVL